MANSTYNAGMRRCLTLAALVAAAVLASSAYAVSPPIRHLPVGGPTTTPGAKLTVTLSSSRAGAKHVTVTLAYSASLRCGHPAGGMLLLPAGVSVAPKSEVLLNGALVKATVGAHTVVVLPAARSMCTSTAVGPVTMKLTGVANPAKSGTYTVKFVSSAKTYAGSFDVS